MGVFQHVGTAMAGNVTSVTAELEQRSTESLRGTINRHQIENNANIQKDVMDRTAKTLDRVDTVVALKLEEQKLRVDAMMLAASHEFAAGRVSVRQLVKELEQKLLAMGDGNLQRVGTNIVELENAGQTRVTMLAAMHQGVADRQTAIMTLHEDELKRPGAEVMGRIAGRIAQI